MSGIIVDFDGTIADSLPVAIKIFYDYAKIEPFSDKRIQELRNMTLKDVIHEVNIPLWKVPGLLVKARAQFSKHLAEVPIFDGMPDVLNKLHTNSHKMYVISSNSPQNIRKFLKAHKINQYFDGIHGNTGLFGKTTTFKHIIKHYKLDIRQCYAIGDETRDVDAAKKANIKSIAVTWGYNAEPILRAHKPDSMADKPNQLLKLIQ